MVQKKWMVGSVCLVLVVLLLSGYMAIASELGSKDDSLVALSYITDELAPSVMKKLDESIAAKTEEYQKALEQQYAQYADDLEKKVASFATGSSGDSLISAVTDAVLAEIAQGAATPTGGTFQKVVVPAGKTLSGSEGCELVLRLGSATCVASASPGLVDLTTAGDLASGNALQRSHLYLVTIEGHGMKAGDSDATVFVRGSYTIQ